jgi:hypothetical protein
MRMTCKSNYPGLPRVKRGSVARRLSPPPHAPHLITLTEVDTRLAK